MSTTPDIETVDTEEDYIHVRFRDPDGFDAIRTPDWAARVAREVADGAEVRMGRRDGDQWVVQSVLVKKAAGESKAKEEAAQIVEKVET